MTWKTVFISSVVDAAQTGFASGADVEDGILQVRMNNIVTDGSFDWSKKRRVPTPARGIEKILAKSGDILFNHTNSPELVGKSAFFSGFHEPVTFSNHFICLRPQKSVLDGRFLARWLQKRWSEGRFQALCKQWVNQATVSKETLLGLEIPLPPLEEQKRIAAILDQADDLRRKRQRTLDRLNQLGQAIFFKMFGDPLSPDAEKAERLVEIAELINGDRSSNYPSGDDIKDHGVLFLNTTNIQNGELNLSKSQFITEQKFASLTRGKLERGDLIITLRGTLGQCALFDSDHKTGFINAQMMIIRCGKRVLPRYLKEFISFPSVQNKLNRSNSGSAVPQLTGTQMKEMQIIVPSAEEQREFVNAVDRARELYGLEVAYAKDLNALFTSLQHRAFRGEL